MKFDHLSSNGGLSKTNLDNTFAIVPEDDSESQ